MNDECDASLPLTTGQRGLWVGHKIGAADATLNIAEMLDICGPIQPERFLHALRQVTREVETLRVRIIERNGRPWQIVRPEYHGEIPFLDVSREDDPRAAAEAWMLAELTRPVDLANDPLWVSALIKVGDERFFWYQRAHHAIFDGYSGGMVARRLAELYTACVEGSEPASCGFEPLRVLIEAEAAYRNSTRLHRDRAFWKERLADLPEAVSLARSSHRRSMGGLRRSVGHLSSETTRRLEDLGKLMGASLPQVLIGLIAAYYHRATGASDLVIGMPVSGRVNALLRRAPGMVANVVAIRLSFTPQMTAAELFAQVAHVVRQALRHQQYRYEDLRRDLGLVSQTEHIAWLGVNIEPFDYQLSFAGAKAVPHNVSNGSAEDLTVFVYDRGDGNGLRFDLDANPALYSMAELDEHRRRLMRLIDAVLADPAQPLWQLDILGSKERQRLLFDWNDTRQALPEISLPTLIARQAAESPEAPAVIFEDLALSYRELHERSVKQARQLMASGVLPGDVIAVALPRSEQLLIVLLAIMRAGAAYLPLDPDGPSNRVAMMLDDANPVALIAQSDMHARFACGSYMLLAPEQLDAPLAGESHEPDFARPDATAYVLYTSGSSGQPKGVEVTHANLGNFLHGMQRQLAPAATDRFLAVTPITFDIAALELFLPLTVGARTVIASSEALHNPPLLARLIQRSGATHIQATPSLWRVLLASSETRLVGVHALVGGEALSAELASRLKQRASRVTQFYGPTETTVWSTAFELGEIGTDAPPIGRPILNTQVYVLDEQRQPVLTGAIGELYIGGAGVAKGYLNRRKLTKERFLPDPFADDGSRMYRTGDRVRWNDAGMLEFVGRADNQVKVRGHRVEPGEIEHELARHVTVAEAAVTAHRNEEGGVALTGYLVAAAGKHIDIDQLRTYLAGRLPEYMIPSSFMVLDALPLTSNGKLDRKALPAPDRAKCAAYVPPVTPVEKKLAALWQEIFHVERVGLHDNFFDLGGDSLAAAELVARFPEHFAMELPLASLFEASTVAGLAAHLQRAETESDPLGPLLSLRISRQKRPLFCIHPVVGLSWAYAGLLRHLDDTLPVYGLQAHGLRGGSRMHASIGEMAADYVVQIRRLQAQGPYRLLGWSLGGLIAHEMAAQLQAQGQQVEFLGLMDAFPFVAQGAQQHRDEAHEVKAILRFLGFHRHARENPPANMASLAELLCREYDVFAMPLVQEIVKTDPQLIEHVSAVTRNNLTLARRHVPQCVDMDVMFFRATAKESMDLDGVLYDHPAAWRPFVDGELEVHEIACHHQAMLDAAPAMQIGSLLRQRLDALEAKTSSSGTPAAGAPYVRAQPTKEHAEAHA